jgi:hypothetical protein
MLRKNSIVALLEILRSAVALRPAKSRKFDRATIRDIIRDRESSRFQVVVDL